MGRNSFEKVRTFGFWPYENIPVFVLTSRRFEIPEDLKGKVRFKSLAPDKLIMKLEKEGFKHLYIDGGKTIQSFLELGLINEITITRIPILLGSGIPLFSAVDIEHPLRLIAASSSDNGFVQVRYEVASRE